MSNNPYQSPDSDTIPPPSHRSVRPSFARSLASILLGGVIVDFIGTYVAFFVTVVIVLLAFGDSVDPVDWLREPPGRYVMKAMGISFSFAGGAIAAFFAGCYEKLHALASTGVALGSSFLIQGMDRTPSGLLTIGACVASAALAGKTVAFLRSRQVTPLA